MALHMLNFWVFPWIAWWFSSSLFKRLLEGSFISHLRKIWFPVTLFLIELTQCAAGGYKNGAIAQEEAQGPKISYHPWVSSPVNGWWSRNRKVFHVNPGWINHGLSMIIISRGVYFSNSHVFDIFIGSLSIKKLNGLTESRLDITLLGQPWLDYPLGDWQFDPLNITHSLCGNSSEKNRWLPGSLWI